MNFNILTDDVLLFSMLQQKARVWFLFKITTLLIFIGSLLNMHVTFDLYWFQ